MSMWQLFLLFFPSLSHHQQRQWRRKEVIEWGPNDETIKYNEYKKYIYKPELSADWDQEITTVNPIVAVSIYLSIVPATTQAGHFAFAI